MDKIEILRSRRKTLAIEIKSDLRVLVRAPLWVSNKAIEAFLSEKAAWIEEKSALMKTRLEKKEAAVKYSPEELSDIKALALNVIPARTAHFAPLIGVDYGKITLRFQRTLWGSCSEKGNLSFNALLALCPEEVTDYVILHELCHRKHLNHSSEFWAEVEKHVPNYKEARAWLRSEGKHLIEKI